MKTRKQKKGFTIVELVIVLAVVGVLAAILIPTFTNIINKANTAKDQSLVYNLNEALILEEIDHNGKYDTMHDTLTAMDKNQGFGIDRIKVTSKNSEILWDSVNNRFVMVTKNGNAEPTYYNGTDEINYPVLKGENKIYEVDLWRISDTVDENSPYSTYYTGTETTVTTSKGFDAGNSNVTTVTYNGGESAQSVVVRTNGGNLTIDAEHDTVKHYGEVSFLNIKAINTSSYHEYGYAPYAQISKGRIVNEAGSVKLEDGSTKQAGVENLFIVAASEGSETEAGSFNDIIVEAAQGASVPTLDRSDVNIIGAILVVEVKTPSSDDFVYLTKAGIIEQVVVTSQKGNTDTSTASATFGTDTTLNDASLKAANEIANIAKRGENGRPLKDDGETEMTEEEVAALESVDDIVISEPKATLDDLSKTQGENALFAGGAGTKVNPYLISNEDWWKKFADLCSDDTDFSETTDKFFRVTSDIDVSKYETGTLNILYFAGNIDFENHKIYGWHDEIIGMATNQYFGMFDIFKNATIENCNFYTFSVEDTYTFPITHSARGKRCEIKNCNVYGNCDPVNWNNTGYFATYPKCTTLVIENCNNYANLVNSGYSSAFVGRLLGNDMDLYFVNCNNYANIISTTAGASMLIANPTLWPNDPYTYNIHTDNCNNYGVICGQENYMTLVISTKILYPSPTYTTFKVNNVAINTDGVSQQVMSEKINGAIDGSLMGSNVAKLNVNSLNTSDGYFVLPEITGAVRYSVSFGFTPSDRLGARAGYTLSFTDLPSNLKVGNWTSNSEIDNKNAIVKHNEYGTTFYTYGDSYVYYTEKGGTIQSDVIATFVAFDEVGNILYMATYTY